MFEAGSDVASGGADGGMPFHEALARRLELLQSSGALGVAQVQRPACACSGRTLAQPWLRWVQREQT